MLSELKETIDKKTDQHMETNIYILLESQKEKRNRCRKRFKEIMAENFPNLMKEMNIHV